MTAPLTFAHKRFEPVTAVLGDQEHFYRAANVDGTVPADSPYISHEDTVQRLTGVIERHAPQGAHVVGFSLGAQLAILLASERSHLVRGVVVVSAETKPAPFPGPTLALLSLAPPLARHRRFAAAQAHQLGIPNQLSDDYLHDSTATTRETLLSSVSENIRFTLPATWSDYKGAVDVLVGANERNLCTNPPS